METQVTGREKAKDKAEEAVWDRSLRVLKTRTLCSGNGGFEKGNGSQKWGMHIKRTKL